MQDWEWYHSDRPSKHIAPAWRFPCRVWAQGPKRPPKPTPVHARATCLGRPPTDLDLPMLAACLLAVGLAPQVEKLLARSFADKSNRFETAMRATSYKLRDLWSAEGEEEEAYDMLAFLKQDLTYGEFDLASFEKLLAMVAPQEGEVFIDIGSGCGRLVCAAALLYPSLARSVGIELLEDLNEIAVERQKELAAAAAEGDPPQLMAPCEFICDQYTDALPRILAPSADGLAEASSAQALVGQSPPTCVAFAYATSFTSFRGILPDLSEALGDSLPAGSRVIIVDRLLADDEAERWSFEEISILNVDNDNTYVGKSDAVIYKLRRDKD